MGRDQLDAALSVTTVAARGLDVGEGKPGQHRKSWSRMAEAIIAWGDAPDAFYARPGFTAIGWVLRVVVPLRLVKALNRPDLGVTSVASGADPRAAEPWREKYDLTTRKRRLRWAHCVPRRTRSSWHRRSSDHSYPRQGTST